MGIAAPVDALAAFMLANKIKEKLGVEVEASKLADFIDAEWETVSGCSHAVHNWRNQVREKRKPVEPSNG